MKKLMVFLCGITLVLGVVGIANCATIIVDANFNIFGAGHAVPPNVGSGHVGVTPVSYNFQAGTNQVLSFSSVTGSITYNGGGNYYGPEDWYGIGNSTDIISVDGISGIYHGERRFFLAGVFLNETEPSGPAPSVLNFGITGIHDDFGKLYPEINQTFFIGDGLTGTGEGNSQLFYVPEDATRLFLGFEDGYDFEGLPCLYSDNLGSLTAYFDIVPDPVPIPGAVCLLGSGLIALVGLKRKFKS